MNTLTRRLIFCFCAGVVGAALALQFAGNIWTASVVALLAGFVGWVMADAEGFWKKTKSFIKVMVAKLPRGAGENSFVSFSVKMLIRRVSIHIASLLIIAQIFLVIVAATGKYHLWIDRMISSPEFWVGNLVICFIFGICDVIKGSEEQLTWKKIFAPAVIFLPPILFFAIAEGISEYGEEVLIRIHTDERMVYAICIASGTLGGFLIGKTTGLPIGALSGGFISLAFAWLDWKILSLKFGWRQAT